MAGPGHLSLNAIAFFPDSVLIMEFTSFILLITWLYCNNIGNKFQKMFYAVLSPHKSMEFQQELSEVIAESK